MQNWELKKKKKPTLIFRKRQTNIFFRPNEYYQKTKYGFKNVFVIAYAHLPQEGTETNDAYAKVNAPKVPSRNKNWLLDYKLPLIKALEWRQCYLLSDRKSNANWIKFSGYICIYVR